MQFFSLLLLMIFFVAKGLIPQAFRYDAYYVLPMAAIIITFSFQGGWFGKVVSNRFFVLLGEASFSLYLIHYLVLRCVVHFRSVYWLESSVALDLLSAVLVVLLSIIVGLGLYLCFEKRVQSYFKRVITRRQVVDKFRFKLESST
jgi:peptidoglycan/LPS O-acetylase OafA/YrhL